MSAVVEAAKAITAEIKKRRDQAGVGQCPIDDAEQTAIAELLREVYIGGHQRFGRYWITFR